MDTRKLIFIICWVLLCNASVEFDSNPFELSHLTATTSADSRFVRKSPNNPAVTQSPPAMTEEERILSKHFPNKDDWDDSDYDHADDYDDEIDLDATQFDKQLQEADKLDTELPMFLEEPQNAIVSRGKPATLRCKAVHAMQVSRLLGVVKIVFTKQFIYRSVEHLVQYFKAHPLDARRPRGSAHRGHHSGNHGDRDL